MCPLRIGSIIASKQIHLSIFFLLVQGKGYNNKKGEGRWLFLEVINDGSHSHLTFTIEENKGQFQSEFLVHISKKKRPIHEGDMPFESSKYPLKCG